MKACIFFDVDERKDWCIIGDYLHLGYIDEKGNIVGVLDLNTDVLDLRIIEDKEFEIIQKLNSIRKK